jgi:hypothetical protein
MRKIVAVVLFVVLLVILIVLVKRTPTSKFETIPKILWTFWDKDEIPEFIQKCIDTWKKYNPDYKVNVLTTSTLKDYVGEEEANNIINWKFNDSPQRLSDLVRLSVISKFGGIWLDASVVCFNSFDWVNGENSDAIVFSIKELSTDPTIESWFIAAVPGNPYVTKWNEEMRGIDQYESIDDYITKSGTNQDAIAYNINYLVVYLCARKVYHDLGPDSVKIMNATDGPYNYMVKGGIKSLCDEHGTFAKFRKDERNLMTPEVEACIFNPTI